MSKVQIAHIIHSSAWNSQANKRKMLCPRAKTQRKVGATHDSCLGSGLGQGPNTGSSLHCPLHQSPSLQLEQLAHPRRSQRCRHQPPHHGGCHRHRRCSRFLGFIVVVVIGNLEPSIPGGSSSKNCTWRGTQPVSASAMRKRS